MAILQLIVRPTVARRRPTPLFTDRSPRMGARGVTLLEVLIGLLVLSLGTVGIVHLQSRLRREAELAGQRTEAVHWSQHDIEFLRDAALAPTPKATGADGTDLALKAKSFDRQTGSTLYHLTRSVKSASPLHQVDIEARWTDRQGAPQQASLSTWLLSMPAVYSAALGLAPPAGSPLHPPPPVGPEGGGPADETASNAADPVDGRIPWRPDAASPVTYLWDPRTSLVTGRCGFDSGKAAAIPKVSPPIDRPSDCRPFLAAVLQGHVRFSLGPHPDALNANDLPLPFTAFWVPKPSGGAAQPCAVRRLKAVRYTRDGRVHHRDVDLPATAVGLGATAWRETGERHAAYACLVPLPMPMGAPPPSSAADPGPSPERLPDASVIAAALAAGRWTPVPDGWAVGTAPGERRICRYSAVPGGTGGVGAGSGLGAARDTPVARATRTQNHLVVRGDRACPHSPAPPHNDPSADTVPYLP